MASRAALQASGANHGRVRGVAFSDLSVCGYTKPTDYQRTVSNFPLVILKTLSSLVTSSQRSKVVILRGCEGLAQTGEMVLVLGRPGSGCTSFLKAIAGELHGISIEQESELNYQGLDAETIRSKARGDCTYLAELDVHFPTLTVGETLRIAERARSSHESNGEDREKGLDRSSFKETIQSLGLSHALDTKVGNDFIPGISGGERKRLSIAEVLLGRSSLQCWDNSTRGLDSSNAARFAGALRTNTRRHNNIAFVSLYQASEEIFRMFDKVLLLYEGRQVYFGSALGAKPYFEKLGFVCPPRTSTADFLTSVTNPALRSVEPASQLTAPRTAEEFARVWKISPERRRVVDDIRKFNLEYPLQDSRLSFGFHGPYTISVASQVRACLVRALLRLRNDLAPPISGIVGNCILAIILGSVFYNLSDDSDSFFGRSALLFFTTLLNAMSSGFEPGMLWEQRPIVEKQQKYAYFHPFADAIASMISDLPNKILTSIFFNIPVYFLTNLRRTAGAFFAFWLFSFACLLTMSMIFRTIGSMSSTLAGSMAPAAVFMLMLMIYTGFTIPTPYMHPWFRWFTYINPVSYTFESLMINEFNDRNFTCSQFIPEGPSYTGVPIESRTCNEAGAVPGTSIVDGGQYISIKYAYDPSHMWRNLGILFAIMVFGSITHLVSTEYLSIKKSKGDVLLFPKGKRVGKCAQRDEENALTSDSSSTLTPLSARQETFWDWIWSDLGSKSEAFVQLMPPPKAIKPVLLWDSLNYEISVKKNTRRILNDLDGWIAPGTLTALMGASGAGKTTLLNVLADRAKMGVVHGDIMVEDSAVKHGYARRIGYAQQQDVHLPTATVREALQFSALLRQSPSFSKAEKLAYVEEVIDMLEMAEYAEAVVGVPGEGLNAEQRKRVTIGLELAARPQLLIFLDEPTSGLDSDTAWAICSLLRRLADRGQAILCTIHQPSATLISMFDRLLLLSPGGKCAYFGEIGENSQTLIDYFESQGAPACKQEENPADWLMETTGHFESSNADCIDWAEKWNSSYAKEQVRHEIAKMKLQLVDFRTSSGTEFAASFPKQIWYTTLRLFSHYWRTPSYLYSKALLCTLTALFIGFSFWMSSNSVQGLQNQIFAVFLLLTAFTNLDQQIINQYIGYRAIYEVREASSRTYSWVTFVLANILVEIPWQTLMSVVLFACWYFPIGIFHNGEAMDMAERAGLVVATIWSFMFFTLSSSFAVVAGMESGPTAVNIAQLLYSLSLIFCGVLVPPASLPAFWRFMYRVSPVTYFASALIGGSLGNTSIVCSADEILRFLPASNGTEIMRTCGQYMTDFIDSSGGYLLNPDATSQCEFCPYSSTDAALANMGVAYADRWRNFGITLAYSVFNIGVTLLLYWLCRVPRRPKTSRR